MTRHYENKAEQTIALIRNLTADNITNISVLVRHSERHYTKDGAMEPFMRLTGNGRHLSHNFGQNLPGFLPPNLYSSFIGRCIETAYLIDKGFTARFGDSLPHTRDERLLSPFYINDIDRVVTHLEKGGDHLFLRNWFNGCFNSDMIDDPQKTADHICGFMIDRLGPENEKSLTVCVSHDWNLFPVKEFMLHRPFEQAGDIGYLEGVVFFKKRTALM